MAFPPELAGAVQFKTTLLSPTVEVRELTGSGVVYGLTGAEAATSAPSNGLG